MEDSLLRLRLLGVVLFSIVCIFLCIQPAGAQAPTMYLPALEAVDGTELALALVNSGPTDAQVAITARTNDGEVPGRRYALDGSLRSWIQHVPTGLGFEPLAGGKRLLKG